MSLEQMKIFKIGQVIDLSQFLRCSAKKVQWNLVD